MADKLQSMVGPCPVDKELRNDLTAGALLVRIAERVTSKNKVKPVLVVVSKSHITVLPKGGGDPRVIPLEYVTEVMVSQKKVPQMLFRVANSEIADLIINFTREKRNLEPSASVGNFFHVFQRLMLIQYNRQIEPKAVEGSLYQRSNIERLGSTSSKLNFKQAIQQQKHSQPPPPPPPPPPSNPPQQQQQQQQQQQGRPDFSNVGPPKPAAPPSSVSSSFSSNKVAAKPTFGEVHRADSVSSAASSRISPAEKAKMSLSQGYSNGAASRSSSQETNKFSKQGTWVNIYHKASQLSVVVAGGNRIGLGSPAVCFYATKGELQNGFTLQDELGRYWTPTADGKHITLSEKERKDVVWLHDDHGILWETSVRSAAHLPESPGPGAIFSMKSQRITEHENVAVEFTPCEPPRHIVQKNINKKQVAYNNEAKLATDTLAANRNHLDLLSEQQLKFLNIHNNQLAGQTELLNSAKQLQELQRQQDEFRRKQQEMLRLQQQENNRMLNETIQGLQQLEVAQQQRHNELSVERDRLIAEKDDMVIIKDSTFISENEEIKDTRSQATPDPSIPHTHSEGTLSNNSLVSPSGQAAKVTDKEADKVTDKVASFRNGYSSFLKKHDPSRAKEATELAKKAVGREELAYRELLSRYRNCPVRDADFLREDQISSIKNEVRELRALLEEGGPPAKRSVRKGFIDSRYLIELPVGRSVRPSVGNQSNQHHQSSQNNQNLLSPLAPNGGGQYTSFPQSSWTRQPHRNYYNSDPHISTDYRYSDR